jgi:hypothetical protein
LTPRKFHRLGAPPELVSARWSADRAIQARFSAKSSHSFDAKNASRERFRSM